jgi:hypothetical protein
MGKHAYLIVAHNNWEQLLFLIDILEDPRNDFFLLVDSKAKDFNREIFVKDCPSNNLYFAESMKVYWGDYTLTEAVVSLLKRATYKGKYDYYHLISAIDMPLKSQDEMHRFFDDNQGCEFVDYDSYEDTTWATARIKYYYYCQKLVGRRMKDIIKFARDAVVFIEKICGVNRIKGIEDYLGKGSNWFSITDDFARYIVGNEEFIREHFIRTYCSDEVFVQTLLKMSPYNSNWYGFKNREIQYQNLRYLDWTRGKPYTFKKEEFPDLCKSPYMFARKFGKDIISEDIKQYLFRGTATENEML